MPPASFLLSTPYWVYPPGDGGRRTKDEGTRADEGIGPYEGMGDAGTRAGRPNLSLRASAHAGAAIRPPWPRHHPPCRARGNTDR